MATIPVTLRELTKAWRNAQDAANSAKLHVNKQNNAPRLLLFYAAECGLKAVYLQRNQLEVLDGTIIDELGHNINKTLNKLHAGKSLELQTSLSLGSCKINKQAVQRSCQVDQINQVWRYGAEFKQPNDDMALEGKLLEINLWIASNLR